MTEKEWNKYADEVIAKEREKFPKEMEILIRTAKEDLTIKVKTDSEEYIAKKMVDFHNDKFYERVSEKKLYYASIMMRCGEPRTGIKVYDTKQYAWHQEHMPGINYFPEFLLLEEYGKKWWVLDENGKEVIVK